MSERLRQELPPDLIRETPSAPKERVETRETAPDMREAVARFEQGEKALTERTRDAVAGLVRELMARGKEPLPPWLRKGLFAAMLLSSETAMATNLAENFAAIPHEDLAEDPSLPSIPKDTLKTLKPFLSEEPIAIGSGFPISEIPASAITGDHGFIVDRNLIDIAIQRPLSEKQLHDLLKQNGWKEGQVGDLTIYARTTTDANHNSIDQEIKTHASGQTTETIRIAPNRQVTQEQITAQTPMAPLNIDLSSIGYGSLDGLFYTKPYGEIASVGERKIFGTTDDQAAIDKRGTFLRQGIEHASDLYGEPLSSMPDIYVQDIDDENAGALTDSYVLFRKLLEENSFRDTQNNDVPVGDALTSVFEHETFHEIDFMEKYSDDPLWTALFASGDRTVMAGLAEQNFGEWGGHPQDNPMELFASINATLADQSDASWLTHAEALTLDQEQFLLQTLQALQLIRTEKNAPSAPIDTVLVERTGQLKADLEKKTAAGPVK